MYRNIDTASIQIYGWQLETRKRVKTKMINSSEKSSKCSDEQKNAVAHYVAYSEHLGSGHRPFHTHARTKSNKKNWIHSTQKWVWQKCRSVSASDEKVNFPIDTIVEKYLSWVKRCGNCSQRLIVNACCMHSTHK